MLKSKNDNHTNIKKITISNKWPKRQIFLILFLKVFKVLKVLC